MDAASEVVSRCLNPVILNLKKMELELKCPTCLNLLDQPILLPCTHIFCSPCITNLARNGECPSCKLSFLHQDMRPVDHIKSFVNIYKNMKSAVAASFYEQLSQVTDEILPANESPASGNNYTKDTSERGRANIGTEDALPNLPQVDTLNTNGAPSEIIEKPGQNSPPSTGSIKDLDCDDSDQGSKHGTRKSPCLINGEDIGNGHRKEFDIGKSKRQKLNSEVSVGVNGNSIVEYDHGSPLDASRYVNANRTMKCVFCHSFKATEATGKMLHLLNGKEVDMDQAPQFHVHEKCIEWAPRIYYSGDSFINLEDELARASKIKCSSCGLKGAALGCFVKSCKRSYHVPCAVVIQDCRWDCENFLVLCPAHIKHKLPCDRSKSRSNTKASRSLSTSDSSASLTSLKTGYSEHSPVSSKVGKNWVFCGSALSIEEKGLINEFSHKSGAVETNSWEPSITHVIASVDENGGCTRTLKYLLAILTGKWILSIDWVKASLQFGHPLPEQSYEITHDVHGVFDGPKLGRIRSMQKAPKLLSGIPFYISNDFERPGYDKNLEELILTGGGTLIKKHDLLQFQESRGTEVWPKLSIIYNADSPLKGDKIKRQDVLNQRTDEAEALAAKIGGRTLSHTTFLNNIAACFFPKS